jgi:hypothetical protein
MTDHDVLRFANALSEKLASRSRHVCLFIGAGASRSCGLPDVKGLETHLRGALAGAQLTAFELLMTERSLEQVLSRLRRISALLEGSPEKVDGLTAQDANELDVEICRQIVTKLGLDEADLEPMFRFAAWAARADYHHPVEIFTVNYDLLLETGLESLGVPYFDGFVGALHALFRSDLVEATPLRGTDDLPAFMVRLWKLHGSVHWSWNTDAHPSVVRLGAPVPDNQPAAIYPSDAKYDESRRVPFVVLQDRFRRALNESETLTLFSGYAFGDEHLNEMIFDAARRRPRSEFIAFCYSTIPEALASMAAVTPNLQVVSPSEGILSGLRAGWTGSEDAPDDLWGDESCRLGDFSYLSRFLARSSPPKAELEERLNELLAKAVSPSA